jgi:hypothetical protein
MFEESADEAAFNLDIEKFQGSQLRVRLQIEELISPPLLRATIAENPALAELQIVRMAQVTNSPVTFEQSRELWRLIQQKQKETIPTDALQQRVWLIAPGRDAGHWEEFYRNGFVAIGFRGIGNLARFKSADEIAEEFKALGSSTSSKNNATTCFDFAHTMKEGDLVLVKKGRHSIVGYGIIRGPYQYDETRADFRNIRLVRWQGRGE